MILELVLLISGIICILGGAGLTVEAAKKVAHNLGVSEALIGLTLISIGTSLPEIAVNVGSGITTLMSGGLNDASGVAVGTNIGSCLTQITLILGIVGLIAGNLKAEDKTILIDGTAVLGAIILFLTFGIFFGNTGGNFRITRIEGIILAVIYLLYLVYTTKQDHLVHRHAEIMKSEKGMIFYESFKFLGGIALLLLGAHLIVDNAVTLAEIWGVSKSFIGVMIIGVGTGLPELVTAITAVLKNSKGISVGTLIGSNITDPLLSLGTGAAITGFTVNPNLLYFDIPFWFMATLTAIYFMKRGKLGIDRKEASVMVLFYVVFVFMKLKFFLHA